MFWKYAFAHAGPCGPFKHWKHHHDHGHSHSRGAGHDHGGFGVRRPLRFMARQLDLDQDQVNELVAILDDLKTERAQAKVDHRKAISTFADAFLADELDLERIQQATDARAESAKRVEQAVARALERTHKLLDPEQRKRLAYLLRSEALTI